MISYYRIRFNIHNKDYYLAWAHGEFYITHIEIYARLFSKDSLNNEKLQKYLNNINTSYYYEELKNLNEIRKRFIYPDC